MRALSEARKGDAAMVPHYIEALKDTSVRVRQEAIRALADVGPAAERAVPTLISVIQARADDGYGSAFYALSAITGPTADTVDLLFKALEDADVWRRVAAANSLTRLGVSNDRLLESLHQVLTESGKVSEQGEYWSARLAAGRGLVRLGPEGVRRVLSALRHDASAVRQMAARSLQHVRGEALEETVAALRETLKGEDEDAAQEASNALLRLEDRVK